MEAGPRGQAPGHQDLRRPRHRRPGRHDPRRHRPRSASTPRCARPTAPGTSTRTTTSTTASTSATSAATSTTTRRRVRRARARRRRPTRSTSASAAEAAAGPSIQLRTYRLALITDPTYATYFGGPANVTAAKVTLMNRVNQIYEDETAIRLVLIADNDKLNLNTAAQMTGANGPCGTARVLHGGAGDVCASATLEPQPDRASARSSAPATTTSATSRSATRAAASPASASSAATARRRAAPACPTPVGDFFAVDYVAHEMGHQFAGNHTFNGTQPNCSAATATRRTSVEPGSGSSIMAYAGICQQDNLQPHSDPYWSQRSYEEITALVTGTRAADQRGPERLAARLRRHGLVHADLRRQDERPVRARHELHRRRHPGRAAGRHRGPDRRADRLRHQRRLVHAQLQGRQHRADRPRPEQHRGRHPERDRRAATSSSRSRSPASAPPRSRSRSRSTASTPPCSASAASRSRNANVAAAINAHRRLRRHGDGDRRGQHRLHADVRRRVGRHRRPGDLDRQLHRHLHLDGA